MHTPDSREEQQNISRNDQLHQLEVNLSQLFSNSKWSNKTRRRNQLKHTSEDSDNDSVTSNKSPWYPVQRWGHQTVVLEKYLYLIGGYIEKTHSQAAQEQLYRLDCDTFEWERINSAADKPIPDHRDSHMMCVLQESAYMFGGKKDEEIMLEDLWKMTVTNVNNSKGSAVLNWTKIEATGSVPPARESAQLCGIDGRYILLFGGTNGKDEEENLVVYDDMYILDTQTNEWREVLDKKGAKVEARDSFGMLEVKGYVYIFGGQGSSVGSEDVFYNDLYKLKLEVNSDGSYSVDIEELFPSVSDSTAAAAKRPCGRSSNSMCVVRERYIFIIGGEKGEEMKLDDVWVYDTQDNLWMILQQKKSRHPHLKPLISHSSSVYQDNIIVFGGMYKDENQHSDQTLVLQLNISDQFSETRRSQNSVASILSEDLHKPRTSDGSLKSVLLEDENNLLTNQNDEQNMENHHQNGKVNKNKVKESKDTVTTQVDKQNDNVTSTTTAVVAEQQNNEIIEEDGEEEEEEGEVVVDEEEGDEDQNRVIAVGTAGTNENANHQNQYELEEEGNVQQTEKQIQEGQQQQQQANMDIEDGNTAAVVVSDGIKEDGNNPSYQPSESQLDQHQGSEGENNQDYGSASNSRDRNSKNNKNNNNANNNNSSSTNSNINNSNNPVATTVNILQHQQQQHQQHHHVQPVISEEHILPIRQPYVSMAFLSSIASLIPSPITAFGMLAHNAKSQFASTFQINLMWTPKKDTYTNAANDNVQSNQTLNNNSTSSKVNGQLLTRSIDKELIETSHLFFQIFDDSEGFTPQDFIDIIYKFDYYQAIQYNKSHKELIQDEQGLQAKTQYGNNLKLASLRIGQNVLFISKNKAYNILNVGLISTNGKVNPNLSECIIFLFSMDMKRKVYLSENGDQNKRIILNNIAFLMTEEQLFKHDRGTYIYIFDLKRVPQIGADGYEFQYSVGRKDIVEKKRCFFGEKNEQVERLIDYSLKSSLQHLYLKPPENFHFVINTCRYEFISYSDVLRKQKGMRFLKELNTENVQLLRDLGKVSIYEQVNYNNNSSNSSGNSGSEQQAGSGITTAAGTNSGVSGVVGSPSQGDYKNEKDEIVDQSIGQSNNEQKAEGTTTRKNTSVEFHQGILIYAEERLIGRAESHQFGNAFIDKILNKTKGQQSLFKYVGIVELERYFQPNIFHTGLLNNNDDCLMRSGIKAFIKGQKQQQQLQQQQSQGTNNTKNNQNANANNSDKEKSEKNERTRTRSFDANEEPELRKEIKID